MNEKPPTRKSRGILLMFLVVAVGGAIAIYKLPQFGIAAFITGSVAKVAGSTGFFPQPPTTEEARRAFLATKGREYPFNSLRITSIEFGKRDKFQGKDSFPARIIFAQPDGSPVHTDVIYFKNPFDEWACL